jgi:hypothetical protein
MLLFRLHTVKNESVSKRVSANEMRMRKIMYVLFGCIYLVVMDVYIDNKLVMMAFHNVDTC